MQTSNYMKNYMRNVNVLKSIDIGELNILWDNNKVINDIFSTFKFK